MPRNFTVLGGGITGLVLAHLLSEAGCKVTLIESAKRPGGLVSTFNTAGDPLEHYYHHFFTHDAEIHWLLDNLGLSKSLVYRRTRMGFFRHGRIFDFTTALDLMRFTPLASIDKLRFALSSLYLSRRKSWRAYEGIAALEWFYRFAGREVTETIWKPMLEVKFGSHAPQVPLAWMVGRLGQRMRSRRSGRELLGYVCGSLQLLLDGLETRLQAKGVSIQCAREVKSLQLRDGALTGISFQDGETLPGSEVISTLPSPALAALLPEECGKYRSELCRVEYFGAICLVLRMRRPLSHIYWLNVADPGFPFGGVIEHTNFIPPGRYGGEHIAYLSRYFEKGHALAGECPQKIAAEWIGKLALISPGFSEEHLIGWNLFRTAAAATVCPLNFSKSVHSFFSPLKGLYLVNMAHIYPDERSVNNSIRIAAQALDALHIPHAVPQGSSLAGQIGFQQASAV